MQRSEQQVRIPLLTRVRWHNRVNLILKENCYFDKHVFFTRFPSILQDVTKFLVKIQEPKRWLILLQKGISSIEVDSASSQFTWK